ncbi:uncharacterized protein LOC114875194 [Osmia bicornis bicornis]|uniref:uncharacterized protein LOC114875194 n=1 Tax=Osmia bicornis bicornis TaxID=1437191 RepID=UPI0010F9A550|nr:uncharacterized protein LOC114875194 [Osmia bicornis bicornis]
MADENGRKLDEELYAWISTIPFSKPTKNLNRDFSDAVMMAEILKVYYPRCVDLHNYVPVSSINTKKENWSLLNRKVLSKIDMKLTKDMINQLANCQPGAIENVLVELRNKVSKNSDYQNSSNISGDYKDFVEEGKKEEVSEKVIASDKLTVYSADQLTLNTEPSKSILARVRENFLIVLQWFVSWFFVWNYIPSIKFQSLTYSENPPKKDVESPRTEKISANDEEEESISRQVCAQLRQELREKNDVISTLNHKLAYLESAMKLQDLRISNLTSQILQNAVESEQLGKMQTSDLQTKSRLRSPIIREKIKIEV